MATAKCGNEHKWFTNTTSKWCISGENISAIWPCKKHKSSSSRYSYIIKAAISFLAVIIITIICRKINLYSKPLSHFKQSICTVPSKIYFAIFCWIIPTYFISKQLPAMVPFPCPSPWCRALSSQVCLMPQVPLTGQH